MRPLQSVAQRILLCLLLLILAGCQTTYHLSGSGVSASDLTFLDDIRASRHLVVQLSGSHLDGHIHSNTPFSQNLEEALIGSGVFRSVTIASADTLPHQLDGEGSNPLIVAVVMDNQLQYKEFTWGEFMTYPPMFFFTGMLVDLVRLTMWDAQTTFVPVGILIGTGLALTVPDRKNYTLSSHVQLLHNGARQADNRQQNKVHSSYGPSARLYGQNSHVVQQDSAQRTALQIIRLLREQGEI